MMWIREIATRYCHNIHESKEGLTCQELGRCPAIRNPGKSCGVSLTLFGKEAGGSRLAERQARGVRAVHSVGYWSVPHPLPTTLKVVVSHSQAHLCMSTDWGFVGGQP